MAKMKRSSACHRSTGAPADPRGRERGAQTGGVGLAGQSVQTNDGATGSMRDVSKNKVESEEDSRFSFPASIETHMTEHTRSTITPHPAVEHSRDTEGSESRSLFLSKTGPSDS